MVRTNPNSDKKMKRKQRTSLDIAVNSRIKMDIMMKTLMDIVRMMIRNLILRTPLVQLPTTREKKHVKARLRSPKKLAHREMSFY
jgi:hypothetical protein